jgi:DNA recombination protein RmuC
VLGPALFPALLRTIHLGHITLSVERNAQEISRLLGATRTEMRRIDDVFARLGKQVGTDSTTIEAARTRTRAVDRALRSIEAMDEGASAALIGIEEQEEQEGEGAALDPVKAQP